MLDHDNLEAYADADAYDIADPSDTGVAFYSFSQVDAIPNGWQLLADGPFKHPAAIPAMGWKR